MRKYIIFDILLHNMDEDLSFGPLDPTSHNTNAYLYAPAKPALNIAAATCSHILCFIYLSSPLPPLQQQKRKKNQFHVSVTSQKYDSSRNSNIEIGIYVI